MATEIGRSLDEIDQKVKGLNKTLKASTDETKELDKALKLDPKSAETAEKKMKALQTAVGTVTQKVALLKQKQDEANKALARGDISAAEYKKIELSVIKAENEVKVLNAEITKTQKLKVDAVAGSFDKLTAGLGKAQAAAQKVSKVATAILATLTAAATAFIMVGDELNDTSKKFSISAEQLQIQRNLYGKVTDDAKNYDKALSSMNSIMTSIAKGKGAAYLTTLEKLGVSTTDASGKTKSAAAIYGEVVGALGRVADETERASLASILFGENGLNVANVAALTREEMAAYNAELAAHGIVSSEAAAKAGEIADKIDDCKQQLAAASAELMVALLPVILQLIEIAQTTIIPILTTIAGWFAGMSPEQQKLVFFLLMLLIIMPKVIAVISAIVAVIKAITIASYSSAGGLGAVSVAGAPLWAIILAISAAVLALIILFAMLAGKSKDVTGELNKQASAFGKMNDKYSGMAADMGGTVAVTSANTNTQTVNYDVNINAHGDTPLSQEAAELVADNLADRINAELGGKI
jgi:phage-related minor tail protein